MVYGTSPRKEHPGVHDEEYQRASRVFQGVYQPQCPSNNSDCFTRSWYIGPPNHGFYFKSLDLPDTYMSEIDATLEGLDSYAMRRLETPATIFTSLRFNGANLADTTISINITKYIYVYILFWNTLHLITILSIYHHKRNVTLSCCSLWVLYVMSVVRYECCTVWVVSTCTYRVPLCGMSEIRSDMYAGASTSYSGPRA